jgi:hypothetical protein
MSTPDGDTSKVDYSIDPEGLKDAIHLFLDPVITGLRDSRDSFTSAHGQVKSAHDASTPGWFGGEGNGEVRAACGSFLNEVTWQLEQLKDDQAGLVGSLEDFKASILGHIDWIRNTEDRITNRFLAIHRQLDERGR